MGSPARWKRWIRAFRGAMTASPCRTPSAPPGRKSFCTSTTSSPSPAPTRSRRMASATRIYLRSPHRQPGREGGILPHVAGRRYGRKCMRAMVLAAPGEALRAIDLAIPDPGPTEVVLRVRACGVCRTDLHIHDGELPDPKLPLILGHEIVGTVERTGAKVDRVRAGDRVGVPWLGWACGHCRFCRRGAENLCLTARFTGYQR